MWSNLTLPDYVIARLPNPHLCRWNHIGLWKPLRGAAAEKVYMLRQLVNDAVLFSGNLFIPTLQTVHSNSTESFVGITNCLAYYSDWTASISDCLFRILRIIVMPRIALAVLRREGRQTWLTVLAMRTGLGRGLREERRRIQTDPSSSTFTPHILHTAATLD